MIELLEEVIEHILLHVAHGILFLRIFPDLGNPRTTGLDIVLMDSDHILLRDLLKPIVVQDHLIRPRPAVLTVVVVDLHKAVEQLLDVINVATLDITHNPEFLTLWQEQSAEVCLSALAHNALRASEESLLLGTLQHGTHIDPQSDVIILQPLSQR